MRDAVPTILLMAIAILPGCAPAVLLDNPPDWPGDWAGRRLFNTPDAFIYAADDLAAGETDRLVRTVVEDFRNQTQREASKGLILVTGEGDPPLVTDARVWFEITELSKAISGNKPTPTEEELNRGWAEFEQQCAELGVGAGTLLGMLPYQVAVEQFDALFAFPGGMPGGAEWAVVLPTRRMIRKCNKAVIKATLEKEGIGTVAQVVMAPVLAMAESVTEDAVAVTRDVAVFSRLVYNQADWTTRQAGTEIDTYAERRFDEALGPFAQQVRAQRNREEQSEEAADAEP